MIRENIESQLKTICETLLKEKNLNKDIGLMSGNCGEILLFFEYYKYTNNEKYLDHSLFLLSKIVNEMLPKYKFPSTLARGYSGLGWTIYYLKNNSDIEINTEEIFDMLDYHLISKINEYLEIRNYDFLHGVIGLGYYFLKRGDSVKKKAISSIINGLERTAVKNYGDYRWYHYKNSLKKLDKNRFDLGLAHGNPSILAFLADIQSDDSLDIDCAKLMEQSLNFIKKSEFKISENTTSYYPTYYYDKDSTVNKNRLAWCYGDLGVSCSLWKSGVSMNDDLLVNKAIEILNYNSGKRSLKENLVLDAGLCHGSAGILFIFNEFYKKTQMNSLKIASEYWLEVTLAFAKYNDGIAGYKAYTPTLDSKYANKRGFLEGTAGIGLSLLSYLNKDESKWKEILLIP